MITYAAAWLIITVSGAYGKGVTAIPLPSMEFCEQQIAKIKEKDTLLSSRYADCIEGAPK